MNDVEFPSSNGNSKALKVSVKLGDDLVTDAHCRCEVVWDNKTKIYKTYKTYHTYHIPYTFKMKKEKYSFMPVLSPAFCKPCPTSMGEKISLAHRKSQYWLHHWMFSPFLAKFVWRQIMIVSSCGIIWCDWSWRQQGCVCVFLMVLVVYTVTFLHYDITNLRCTNQPLPTHNNSHSTDTLHCTNALHCTNTSYYAT